MALLVVVCVHVCVVCFMAICWQVCVLKGVCKVNVLCVAGAAVGCGCASGCSALCGDPVTLSPSPFRLPWHAYALEFLEKRKLYFELMCAIEAAALCLDHLD
jgi:hypothetical protein